MIVEIAVISLAVVITLFYFFTAKGVKRKIILVGSNGSSIEVAVEMAENVTTRAKGLMGRESLGDNEGMLFIFDKEGNDPLWMLNTTIPLDAIFLDEKGKVVDIIGMDPCGVNILTCKTYNPKTKAKYILEVNKGFAKKNKIDIGNSQMKIRKES
jgi:uncharacterized membrane protein (UPF0127 family)